jgi:hypothetical protein
MMDSNSQPPAGGGGHGGATLDFDRQVFIDFKNSLLQSLDHPLVEVERWSLLSLVFAALSAVTVLAGCVTAIIVASKWKPGGEWNDPMIIMTIVSNVVAILTTTANVFWNRNLNAARNVLAQRRNQIDNITARLFRKVFGAGDEPSVVTYAHKDARAGRFFKVDRDYWEEESFLEGEMSVYQFRLISFLQSRLLLEDVSKPRRHGRVEIELQHKRVFWIDLRNNSRKEIYKVVDTD